MLWINHRKCLVKLGGTTSEFYREVTNEMYRFLEALDNRVKDSRSVATDAPQTGYKAAQPLAEKEHAFS